MVDENDDKLATMFRTLYPELSEEDLVRAQANFKRYLELVARIVDRELKEGQMKRIPRASEQLELF